ncbi:MAG: hypothetical protein IPI65_15510 [Bacteroidetes bacterium]|nr:hypothetical protein [Bacteroidota bacterium]
MPKLAFDHRDIIDYSYKKLKESTLTKPLWNGVIEEKFTLTQLQSFFETVLDKKFDKGNFRKKLTCFNM